jgi:DNA-binding transcriptional LysR family regulator
MVIQHLAYLAALAREGHFGRAAASCHVSQPTLSAGIRRLEAEFGVSLVQRGQRFEGLTPEGERVLVWAHQILSDVDGMRQEVDAMRAGLTGRLRLGAIPTSLPSVSLLTAPFTARHPGVSVSIHSLTSRQIERGLDDYSLDVGLTYFDSEPLSGVRTLPLYRERYVLLTAADGPFADHAEVAWAEAARTPLCLLTEDMQNRRIVDELFQEAGARPRPMIETNSISTLYAHTRDGTRSSVMAHAWLHLFGVPAGLRAVPLVAPRATRGIAVVTPERVPQGILTGALIEVARELDLQPVLDRVLVSAGTEA